MAESTSKPVILAVDDTPENLDVVKGILTPVYTVKAAINGLMALKIIEKQPPDLILLDIMMPEMNGFEVCEKIKANPETRDIPVIFLTAMDQTTDEAAGFELGAADYITKPVNPPILEARVKTHLALKQSMDELQTAYGIIKGQKERMQEELNVGHRIQMSMVPLVFPAFPEHDEFDIHALLAPAREVGGDFYDFFMVSQDELCLVVGDVSGKGVPAALFMAVTRTIIRTDASGDNSPASIMTRVNNELSVDNPECMFVTLFLGIFNIRTGEFTYTNAGHNPPYLQHADGEIETIKQLHGPIVGAVEGLAYKQDKIKLGQGDILLIFTDGVSEAMDVDTNLYGEERIVQYLSDTGVDDLAKTTTGLLASVSEYAGEAVQSDDITIMALRFDCETADGELSKLDLTIRNELKEIDSVIESFEAFSAQSEIPMPVVLKINMALDELLNNIVSYAFPEGGEHVIMIHAERTADRLLVTVEDDGLPFNPFARSDVDTSLSLEQREIGGLGIHLVKNIMDDVSYKRRKNRNDVTLIMKLED
jgi:sigma-B regulation protein RsbU (phosphoserine phosphatase)